MFIYNIKFNSKFFIKFIIIVFAIITICICGISIYKLFDKNNSIINSTCVPKDDIQVLSTENYTNLLKSVHDDLNSYIGTNIKFSGYLYKVFDFTDDQFVLARNMIISSDYQSVVVGFLCSSKETCNFSENDWIEIEGTISKGSYHGEIPVIKVSSIKKIDKPSDEYVYPPNDTYIPTANMF